LLLSFDVSSETRGCYQNALLLSTFLLFALFVNYFNKAHKRNAQYRCHVYQSVCQMFIWPSRNL